MEQLLKEQVNRILELSLFEGYKWKPSTSQRKAFAQKMQDPAEKADYEARKQVQADKRRAGSKFDYTTAGGNYVPTSTQYKYAIQFLGGMDLSPDQFNACQMVISGYINNDKIHHDYIHIVNELIRSQNSKF